jgi:hypothetical protein
MVRKTRKLSRNTILAVTVGVLILGGIIIFAFHEPNKGSGIIPSKDTAAFKPASSASSATTPSASNQTDYTSTKYNDQPAPASGSLLVPNGTFVSNHRPSLSGSDAQQAEQSTCNTTPGASCYIQFTKDSVVKTLQAQVIDNSGATYWSWNIKDSGFSEGTWKVTAIATLNGQTTTANDGIDLVVAP